jgi:hypothetical protein
MTSRGGRHIIAAAIPDDLFQHTKEETLKFVVCVKQVPDTAAKVTVENGRVTWGDAPLVINPWDEYAVEAALLQKEAYGGSITAITMGDENSKEALKHALAMGCDEAVIVSDPALTSVDTLVASHVLAAAIKKIAGSEPVTIAFFGRQAVDGDMGLTAAQTARVLGWPIVSLGRAYPGNWQSDVFSKPGIDPPVVYWAPSIAASGIAFYTGDRLPKWKGDVFVGSLRTGEIPGTGHLERILFNEKMEELRRESLLTSLRQRIRDVRQGSDGLLYVLSDHPKDGAVLRIEPVE